MVDLDSLIRNKLQGLSYKTYKHWQKAYNKLTPFGRRHCWPEYMYMLNSASRYSGFQEEYLVWKQIDPQIDLIIDSYLDDHCYDKELYEKLGRDDYELVFGKRKRFAHFFIDKPLHKITRQEIEEQTQKLDGMVERQMMRVVEFRVPSTEIYYSRYFSTPQKRGFWEFWFRQWICFGFDPIVYHTLKKHEPLADLILDSYIEELHITEAHYQKIGRTDYQVVKEKPERYAHLLEGE